jgi:hypothetical protein
VTKIVQDVLESLKKGGKLTDAELEATFSAVNLLKMQENPSTLAHTLERLAGELKNLSEVDRKTIDEPLTLLKSQRLDDRVRGTEMLFNRLHKLFNDAALIKTQKQLTGQQLVAECLEKIGPDALRLNPAVEMLFQRYLARQRVTNPNFNIPFDIWLRVSQSERLPKILRLLLTSDQFSKLTAAAALHTPGSANILVAQEVVDRILALMASNSFDVEDKLLRKLGALLEDGTDKISELLKGKLDKALSEVKQKLFLITDLWNLQGNMGEILTLPKQLERLQVVAAANNSKSIFLASDVRISGRRIIVEKDAEKAVNEAAEALGLPPTTVVPASEVDVRSLEFSDDLIIDLGSPGRMTVIEHHESKVTRQSIADGVQQIDDNTERMQLSAEISIGRLYKLEGDRLAEVDLSEIKGFKVVQGPSGSKAPGPGSKRLPKPRLLISESDDFIAKAKKQDADIEREIAPIEGRTDIDDATRRRMIADVIARHAREELEHKNLLGLKSSKKVLFTPDGQPGDVPKHICNVPMGFVYGDIIDFCNLLLVYGGFRRF